MSADDLELNELQLKSQAADRAYREALAALREALVAEKEALGEEIRYYEDIDGCLTLREDKRYDALLNRVVHVGNQLNSLYH